MGDSSIEWTDKTLNPIRARRLDTGKIGWHCEHVSPGCTHCYADTFNGRNVPNGGTALDYTVSNRENVEIFLDIDMLRLPLTWRKPRKVFVCSMTDLFAEFVPFEMVDKVLAIMALAPQHTYQILTKRAERMAEYFESNPAGRVLSIIPQLSGASPQPGFTLPWPLPNVLLGVSVENQKYAEQRIPFLLRVPAVARFVSAEPLLGPINFTDICGRRLMEDHDALTGENSDARRKWKTPHLDWVIVGGESGHGARLFDVRWARWIVQQCKQAGVPVFIKQLGKHPVMDGVSLALELDRSKGGDMEEWPEELRVREFPVPLHG